MEDYDLALFESWLNGLSTGIWVDGGAGLDCWIVCRGTG